MDFMETIAGARDAMTVKRVYGDPYEHNGVAVIPAAAVQGGGGGGGGEEDGRTGGGGGFGLRARPVGAYVIRGEQVHWESALDLNRAILGGQLLALAALLVVRSIARREADLIDLLLLKASGRWISLVQHPRITENADA
jgi:uncharacterized spore protein YtfJ